MLFDTELNNLIFTLFFLFSVKICIIDNLVFHSPNAVKIILLALFTS